MMTNQTESVLERLREGALETRNPNTAKTAEVPPLDTALLAFLFRSTHLDLVSATQAKVDRSAAALKQSAAIIRRLRSRFIALPESLNLLILTQDLITKDVTVETDSVSQSSELVSICILFCQLVTGRPNLEGKTNISKTFISDYYRFYRAYRRTCLNCSLEER